MAYSEKNLSVSKSYRETIKRKSTLFGVIAVVIALIVIGLITYCVDSYWSSSNTTDLDVRTRLGGIKDYYKTLYEGRKSDTSGPYARTPLGGIKGYYERSYEGRQYEAYEGIPYALPPTGERRFEPPSPVTAWKDDIEAVAQTPICVQATATSITGEEDCLYLHIYVPAERSTSLPTLIYIFGGAFMIGGTEDLDPKYLMDRDMILVTVNYRVGALGFLSTRDEIIPGNAGLKDQSMALRWVSENIRYFGGHPKRLTLSGASSGGASVHYHYFSPMSAGLFRNGISFSGTALDPFAYANDTLPVTRSLANALGCPVEVSATMVKCLKEEPVERILNKTFYMMKKGDFIYTLFPPVPETIESNYFINSSPIELLSKGKIYDAPWITGSVEYDGLINALGFITDKEKVAHLDRNWEILAPYLLYYNYNVPESKFVKLAKLSKKHYFGDQLFSTNRAGVRNFTKLLGDPSFVIGAERAVKLQASVNKSPVWFYRYMYRATLSVTDILTKSTERFGVCHSDDVALVIWNKYYPLFKTAEDKAILKDMLDFWFSVVDKMVPDLGVEWPRYNASSKDVYYMNIAGPKNYSMEINNNLGEIKFWNSIGL